ncbi:hypothetical protein [Polluticoccus soli]|uniref:hypothetical protein n=1 Tax=Polluticoccus soli TaxID=3034150 RepID=UPI0023E1E063|nr:hypothetical protein [Flavipsychrobacter sp. JY13-12]
MRFFFLLIGCLFILSSNTCKKTTREQAAGADSLSLHRSGGFAGFSDYYMIYPDKVLKDNTPHDQEHIYDYPETSKIAAGRALLKNIPDVMWAHNNGDYGTTVADGIDYSITAYVKGEEYSWIIRHDPPEQIQQYAQRINEFFSK